jgi:hypothetical protein
LARLVCSAGAGRGKQQRSLRDQNNNLIRFRRDRREAVFLFARSLANVRFWHKADIPMTPINVRFWW